MSIVFILYGIFVILIMSKCILIKNKFIRILTIISVFIFLISFFTNFKIVNNVYYNSFQIISFVVLFAVLICSRQTLYVLMSVLSLMLVVINLKIELNNFTFGVFDLGIFFEAHLIMFLISKIVSLLYLCRMNWDGNLYDKKIMLNSFGFNYAYTANNK